MTLRIDDVSQAVNEARNLQRAVDANAQQMARLISGRLRASNIPPYVLKQLKHELRDFNMKTGTWK